MRPAALPAKVSSFCPFLCRQNDKPWAYRATQEKLVGFALQACRFPDPRGRGSAESRC